MTYVLLITNAYEWWHASDFGTYDTGNQIHYVYNYYAVLAYLCTTVYQVPHNSLCCTPPWSRFPSELGNDVIKLLCS